MKKDTKTAKKTALQKVTKKAMTTATITDSTTENLILKKREELLYLVGLICEFRTRVYAAADRGKLNVGYGCLEDEINQPLLNLQDAVISELEKTYQ